MVNRLQRPESAWDLERASEGSEGLVERLGTETPRVSDVSRAASVPESLQHRGYVPDFSQQRAKPYEPSPHQAERLKGWF